MATTYCGNCGEQGVEHEGGFLYCRVCGVRLDGQLDAITTSATVVTGGEPQHATVTPSTVEASATVHLPEPGE